MALFEYETSPTGSYVKARPQLAILSWKILETLRGLVGHWSLGDVSLRALSLLLGPPFFSLSLLLGYVL